MISPAFQPLGQADLILASASPRRSMLLQQLGLKPRVVPSQVEEVIAAHLTPPEVVESLSHLKASDVASQHPAADLVLGADTIVVLHGEILGKPKDPEDAVRMLSALAGTWHQVYTGYTLVAPKKGLTVCGHAVTEVRFRDLSRAEIDAYIATGEPMDKAGAYGIQERASIFVTEIRGDYSNVVGLPVPSVDAAWRELGWSLF
jgi:septum formation protein